MPNPKLDVGDLVKVPHPSGDMRIIGEVTKVTYDYAAVRYGVRWWEGSAKHFGTFAESEVAPADE